jgi:hypothetical protein
MENDCAFANLEDKFKEKQKVAVESIKIRQTGNSKSI